MINGAKVIAINGNFDRALEIVREITAKHPITLVNSVNPFRIEGQKTAAFEKSSSNLVRLLMYSQFRWVTQATSRLIGKGSKNIKEAGKSNSLPRMVGFEAEGAMAIVKGEPILEPETVATAIRIGNPASWKTAVAAAEESGGQINYVTDEEILTADRMLAAREGVFAEPASAASLAGVYKLKSEGYFKGGETVVCVLTGNGLKDPNIAIKTVNTEPLVVEDSEEAVMAAIAQLEQQSV